MSLFDGYGAAHTVVDGYVAGGYAWETRNDAYVAHAFVDETLELAVGGFRVHERELDYALLVYFVLGLQVQVDEQRCLLGQVASYGGAHANAVTDEVANGQLGVGQGVVDAVRVGAYFESGALGHPVDEAF